MSVDGSLISNTEFKGLQGSVKHLEEELEEKNGVIEELERDLQKYVQ